MVLLQCAVLLTGCALLVRGGAARWALGSWTAGAVAGASASDADVSEACSAHAVVERPDDWESKVRLANDLLCTPSVGTLCTLYLRPRTQSRESVTFTRDGTKSLYASVSVCS